MMKRKLFALLLVLSLASQFIPISTAASISENNYILQTAGYNPTPNSMRSIIGDDNRIQVITPTAFPYSAVALFETIEYNCGCSTNGSGFMVSEKCLLTAAHCLYCSKHKSNVKSVYIKFGYNGTTESCLKELEVTDDNASFYINPNYTGTQNNYDYGYILFDQKIGNETGWFALSAENTSTLQNGLSITVAGYAKSSLSGTTGTILLRKCAGTTRLPTSYRVSYDADTIPENSGCPVYYTSSSDAFAVAIHTLGTSSTTLYNSGVRITNSMINTLSTQGCVTILETE